MKSKMTLPRAVSLCLLTALVACGGEDRSTPETPAPSAPPVADEPVGTSVAIASMPRGDMLAGRAFNSRIGLVLGDSRNRITGLSLSNPTAGGAVPSIDAVGQMNWTPTEVDFQSTRLLSLRVQLAVGGPQTLEVPVTVRKERVVLETTLPTQGGTVADRGGRYLLKVEPRIAGATLSGTLRLVESYTTNGSFRFRIEVPPTAGADVTVLDSPSLLTGADAGVAGPSAAAPAGTKSRLSAKPAAPGMQQDVGEALGGPFLSGRLGLVANVGEVNVYTTRASLFLYRQGDGQTHSPEVARVFQIDAHCATAAACEALRAAEPTVVRRAPVILVHGFNPSQSVGGGDGTWDAMAPSLRERGHLVFELRWITYMRFEEAAGVLATLATRVAQITGQRPQVVAHSFGGVVAHTAAMGQGIRFDGTRWNAVPVDGVFDRLLTLASPLSGIRNVPAPALALTGGRDDDDASITLCESLNCYQAGSSSDNWDADEIDELVNKVSALDPDRIGLPDRTEGATIRNLHQAWQDNGGHSVPFTSVVALKKRPQDYSPRLGSVTAHDLGDGLISLMGQSVVPTDFANQPFAERTQHGILGALGDDFLTRLDGAFASNMVRIERNGRNYFFAMRASHSLMQDRPGYYRIAAYPANGRIDVVGFAEADHPLRSFIESADHLAAPVAIYTAPPEVPTAVVRGRTVLDGAIRGFTPVGFQIERADDGTAVSDVMALTTRAVDGGFSFDAGAVLAERFAGQLINVADYKVVLRAGDGVALARVTLRQSLAADVNLGSIELALPDAVLVRGTGTVIDGQTQSQAIAGADVFVMKGLYQAEAVVREVADTQTSRHVVSGSSGQFVLEGLEPGLYTVVVAKEGYITQTQGAVRLSASGGNVLSVSLLVSLQANEAAITLRWGDSGAGPQVSSDLDSHLLKFSSTGVQTYHISWRNKLGNATDSLDRDDTDYVGPETITLSLDSSSRYRYYVDNYRAGNGSTLGGSTPTVIVRLGQVSREFSLPIGEQSTAKYWLVFDIVGGVVVPCAINCLTDIAPQ